MKAVWIDAGNGAAGDMLLAALIDAGASRDRVGAALASLAVERIELTLQEVRRHGFRAAHVRVEAPESGVRRALADVLRIIDAAPLPSPVADFADGVFRRLAEAEAEVHGVAVEEVHFHEVGALDAIADVVGCSVALHDLGLLSARTRVVSPVAVGSGSVRSAHGNQPVPAPAVLELLTRAAAPIAGHTARMELCTPTGAALLSALATAWGPPPSLSPNAVGIGAGSADATTHPNILRVLIGREREPGEPWESTAMQRIDATVDDLDPRIWPDLLESLRRAGAADAWCTPALMRKGRPGQVLSVLATADLVDTVTRVVFEGSTTLGVRISPVVRRSLRRDEVRVEVEGAPIRVKRGLLGGRPVTVQPEYEDALRAAADLDRPVAELLDVARELGRRAAVGADRPGAPGAPGCASAEDPELHRGPDTRRHHRELIE